MPCRDCSHYDAPPGDLDPRRIHPCNVDVGPPPQLAACMTAHIPDALHWPPARTFMRPDEGADCSFHQPRGQGT